MGSRFGYILPPVTKRQNDKDQRSASFWQGNTETDDGQRAPSLKNRDRGFHAMTRRGFHVLLALVLVVCVLCPYAEFALDWNQSIFDTGYDGESTVAAIALLLILAFIIANLLAHLSPNEAAAESRVDSHITLRTALEFISTVCDVSPPPLSLRI